MATTHFIGPVRVGALEGADSAVVLGVGTAHFFSSVVITRGTATLVGPVRVGQATNYGVAILSQATSYSFTALSAESFSIGRLPANAQLLNILVDVVTGWDSDNARLSIGDSSASALYMGGTGSTIDINSGGRVKGSAGAQLFNGAQVGSMYNIGSARSVMGYILNSTAPGAGSLRVSLVYVQR